jgi:translocation protein SEC62
MIEKHTGANVTEASNYTSTVGTSHAPSSTEANPDTQADEGQDSEYDDDTIRSSKA